MLARLLHVCAAVNTQWSVQNRFLKSQSESGRRISMAEESRVGSAAERQLCMSYLYGAVPVKQLIRPAIKRNRLCYRLRRLTWGLPVPLQSCSNCKKGRGILCHHYSRWHFLQIKPVRSVKMGTKWSESIYSPLTHHMFRASHPSEVLCVQIFLFSFNGSEVFLLFLKMLHQTLYAHNCIP